MATRTLGIRQRPPYLNGRAEGRRLDDHLARFTRLNQGPGSATRSRTGSGSPLGGRGPGTGSSGAQLGATPRYGPDF